MIIRARIYVDVSDFSAYLEVVGELNLSIMKIVEDAGAHFVSQFTQIPAVQGWLQEQGVPSEMITP